MSYTRLAPRGVCAALLLLGLLSGCGGGGSTTPVNTGPITSAPRTASGLQFTLTADKSVYKVGEAVNFTLTVKNVGTQNVNIDHSLYDPFPLVTITQGTQMVWNTPSPSTGGLSTGQGAPAEVLQPGESLPLDTAWSQTTLASGKQVAAGQYTVSAQLNGGLSNSASSQIIVPATSLSSNSIQITVIP